MTINIKNLTCENNEVSVDDVSITNLHSEIESLRTQLAKANERVRDLHKELVNRHNQIQELRQENGEYAILIANLVRRADVKTDLLQNPTFEKASEQLNKFAIEKMAEGATLFASSASETGQFGWSDCQWLSDFAEEFADQLRKEQGGE